MLSCHWCYSNAVKVLCGAVVAPWILTESTPKLNEHEGLSEYCCCSNCGLHFFSKSFSKSQLAKMYSHYRDQEYQKNRQRYEPWYTKKFNSAIGNDEKIIALRRENLLNLVNFAVAEKKINPPQVLVDWGGDRGQFIPPFPSLTKKFVYEVSDALPVEGVERIKSVNEVKLVEPDFLMLCHVLEHDHLARETLALISNLMLRESVLYLEIPDDRISVFPKPGTHVKFRNFLLRHRTAFIVVDAYSLFTLRILGKRFPFQILKQSEHVNFFCQESILKLTNQCGFEVIAETRYCMNGKNSKASSNAIGLLLRKNQ